MDLSIEWESDTTRLVRLTDLKRHPNFPLNWRRSARFYEVAGRRISKIFVHQTAGSAKDGPSAAYDVASWIVKTPRYVEKNGKQVWSGGGRGFPGTPYTFMVPHRPDIVDGKSIVYRCWDDEWVTWHTRRFNKVGVGVAFAGSFQTRHSPKFSDSDPTSMAMAAGTDLIQNYLMDRYGVKPDDVMGHFDAGKATCPGDMLEAWVRKLRGEELDWDGSSVTPDRRPMSTLAQKRIALSELGYENAWDLRTREGFRLATESVQALTGLVVDGVFGHNTEASVRKLLTLNLQSK